MGTGSADASTSAGAEVPASVVDVELDPGEIITPSHPLVAFHMPRLLVVFLDHPHHLTR